MCVFIFVYGCARVCQEAVTAVRVCHYGGMYEKDQAREGKCHSINEVISNRWTVEVLVSIYSALC